MPRLVTNGELLTFKDCHRKWWLGWFRRLRPKAPQVVGAAPLGTRIHKALQAYYSPQPQNPFAVLEQTILEDQERLSNDPDAVAELLKEADLARAMLEGYVEWLGDTGADQGLSIVGAETRIQAPFLSLAQPVVGLDEAKRAWAEASYSSVDVMGKIDLRVQRDVDGARLFLDHKTVGSIPEAIKGLSQHEQMLHYHLLEYLDFLTTLSPDDAAHAPRTDGGMYNMLRKVKRTIKAKPPFFERVEVHHNVHELRSYYLRVYGEVVDMLTLEYRLMAGEDPLMIAYPRPNRDCSWKCEFAGVCPIFDENREAAETFVADWFDEADPLDRYDVSDEAAAPLS